MHTFDQLKDKDSKALNLLLDELSAQLDDKLPKTGSNADKVERILEAQDRLKQLPDAGTEASEEPKPRSKNKTYRVSSVSKRGFFRCGLFFPHEGVVVELNSYQLKRIREEKRLVIEE